MPCELNFVRIGNSILSYAAWYFGKVISNDWRIATFSESSSIAAGVNLANDGFFWIHYKFALN
jgi:hypothetical protein